MPVVGHGVDIVDLDRIAVMLREHGERFLERCFTEGERAYAMSGGAGSSRAVERLAARFACKEAVFKALGTGWRSGISWKDVEVVRDPSGQPRLVITGRCSELATELQVTRWHVSISHTDTIAIASAIAVG